MGRFDKKYLMFLWSQSLSTYLKNSVSFLSDLCFNQNKNKLCSLHSPAFSKILKEPTILQKQTIPHMKALPISFQEPEGQRCGIIKGAPCPHPVTFFVPFLSEVLEAKWGWSNKNWMFYIKSPYLRIPKFIGFWLECHWIMKKCSSEMHQLESADPVGT